MAEFVLVHGAWSGAHGFHLVRRRLWAAGHEAFTPSLTGIGERVHLTGPGVGLSTHVADVVNHVLYEDLDEIVLVGFSYGGAVVTAALPHLAERVAHLVYVDTFVPADGDTVSSLVGGPPRDPSGSVNPGSFHPFADVRRSARSSLRRRPPGRPPRPLLHRTRRRTTPARGLSIYSDLHPSHGRRR